MIYINKEIAEKVAKEKGVSVETVEKVITAQIERATTAIENRESVRLSNLGFLDIKKVKERNQIKNNVRIIYIK